MTRSGRRALHSVSEARAPNVTTLARDPGASTASAQMA